MDRGIAAHSRKKNKKGGKRTKNHHVRNVSEPGFSFVFFFCPDLVTKLATKEGHWAVGAGRHMTVAENKQTSRSIGSARRILALHHHCTIAPFLLFACRKKGTDWSGMACRPSRWTVMEGNLGSPVSLRSDGAEPPQQPMETESGGGRGREALKSKREFSC
ncbi:hypothetical protein VTN96DRAFT_6691 [Rasamsonia emersonii]